MLSPFTEGRASRALRKRWPARFRSAALTGLTALATFVAAHAQTRTQAPIDLDAALELAEARSQSLPAQQAAALAARERAVAAGQRPDPVLRIGLDNLPVQGGTDNLLTREPMTARSIGIVQTWPDAAKREARSQRYERDALLATARREAKRADLRRDTALAWFAVRAETRRLALLGEMYTESTLIEQAAEVAYRAGRGAQADVFAARALPVRLDDQRLQAEARMADARSALRRWIGPAGDAPLGSAPLVVVHPLGVDPNATLLAADPQLLAAAARESSARALADVAREERRVDWSVDLRFQLRGPQYDNMVTVGVSTPLRWDPANRQDRELAARLAETAQAEAETEELRRVRIAQLESWQQRWYAGLQRLAGYDESLLPLAAARTQAALSAYRGGSGSLSAVLDARQAELATQLERVQIEFDAASDWARLSSLITTPEAAR